MKKTKLSLSLLSILPFLLFSCSGEKDYKLVSYDHARDSYVPLIEDCDYTYDELKKYLTNLPFLIPGDRIKIDYDKEGNPKSFKLIEAKTVLLNAWYSMPCGDITKASYNDYTYSYQTKQKTEPQDVFSIHSAWKELITTDLAITEKLPEKTTTQFYFTYNENIKWDKDDNKIVIQSVWDTEAFEKYVKR